METSTNEHTVDRVEPGGKWEFDGEVAAAFDDMLSRSIPQYEVMRRACREIARHHRTPGTAIVDLGCARGEAMAELVNEYGVHNRFVGVEVSPAMLAACRERFRGFIDVGYVDVLDMDLRREFPPVLASVVMCVLTLQFTPIEYRQRIVQNVHDCLTEGGAFVLVEKVLGADANMDEFMVAQYLALKAENGYSPNQIERKRLSLEGVLVPVTARWNEELLRMAGFRHVDCFWRWMNFAGWVAVK